MMNRTKNLFEGLVREGSFRWTLSSRSSFDEEFEEMAKSPSGQRKWIPELSPMANVIVGRCSRILDVSMDELRQKFESKASDSLKQPSRYARNLLEYCCFRALALYSQLPSHLGDKSFQRLTYDMMLAWEAPAAATNQPLLKVDADASVCKEAFSRIAPAIPTIADVVSSSGLFDALTSSTGGRLSFSTYEKYFSSLERTIKKMKTQSESSLLSGVRVSRGERVLEVDGTVTTQPVLEHVGISTWPGRLTLTDHALYFEPLRVVSYDKAKIYDLSDDLKQVVKPELTGPWGTRLFDKAVMYKSISLPEPIIMEFPELTGHSRRDYWLAIIREILYSHNFIRNYQMDGVKQEEALSKAVLGILRLQALREFIPAGPLRYETLLMFNLADQLPGGDLILETFADMLTSRDSYCDNIPTAANGMHSISALAVLSSLGVVFRGDPQIVNEVGLLMGEMAVGETTALERAVSDSRNNFKQVELAQATVDGIKVQGIDTNLAVMKELLFPFTKIGECILFLQNWDDPFKSSIFCISTTYVTYRGWVIHVFVLLLLFIAVYMLINRCYNQGRKVNELKVIAPPAMNTMEQLLAVQNAISQIEELVQDGNIVLLKLRALLLAVFPQPTERVALGLIVAAMMLSFLPLKYIILTIFLETFTRHSAPRRPSTERWKRRIREWWFSIPAAPVVLERTKEDKKIR